MITKIGMHKVKTKLYKDIFNWLYGQNHENAYINTNRAYIVQ